ncbi:ketopantoate reductase family protein [Saccharibacillus kuerlensis]|uniref:2-dehydropantoate 2-reductase n=1 Tax=Saccharibacillus kuerlensis TaxID=459527 RepID=A0ABQ2KYG4_9BACL|nr:2-dehydropantoate 2-reductase [Saccharibacillus kuerlensis]GGN96596.1 hypothetical protein GCM10010969_13770 [Saccharibacillus kuerlensis]
MKIEVIGGGALGLLFAAGAARGGAQTLLYTRTEEQAQHISRYGIEVHEPAARASFQGEKEMLDARSIHDFAKPENETEDRWILLAVKQKDLNDSLIHKLSEGMRSGDRLLCLQNGIGHLERLEKVMPQALIYAAVTTEGARRLDTGSVLHAGKGSTLFGLPKAAETFLSKEQMQLEKKFEDLYTSAGLSMSVSNEVQTVVYRKLLINAIVNPLTAIWRVENGELLVNNGRVALMRAIFDEISVVYSNIGIPVPENWWRDVLDVCRATARNRSSMLEDVLGGRNTEAKWISGGIAELAHRSGTEAPINRMLLNLIEGIN